MIEISETELANLFSNDQPVIIYCYTPLCGTCQVAKQMLEKWIEETGATIYAINVNFSREFAVQWKIKSVPYVAVFLKESKIHEFYAFHSMENLHRQLSPFYKKSASALVSFEKTGENVE